MGGHESEGSGDPPSGQSDTERDDEANKSMSDHSAVEESDGNAEEQEESAQQDNTQEADEPSGDKTLVKLQAVRCPHVRWPRVQSLSRIPRTAKVH